MIQKGKDIGRQLSHGQHWRVRYPVELTEGKVPAQLGSAMSAQVGNNGAHAAHVFKQRAPEIVIERCRMEKNYRHP
jgi:hypothetical protein